MPPTSRELTVNTAVVAPAGTVTLDGALSGSMAESVTAAPPVGAGAVSTTVPVSETPPTTDDPLSERLASATRATVSVGDCPAAPPVVAEIVVLPAATPVTVNDAVDAPAAIVTGDATVATPVLLLVSVTVTAAEGADASVTVPCVVPPTPMVDAVSVTLETFTPLVDGDVGDEEPQATAVSVAIRIDGMMNVCRELLIHG